MAYAEHLRGLLRPLGVYELGAESLSGGELEALGKAFDYLEQRITFDLREFLPVTAETEGLSMYESLLGCPDLRLSTADRREAILGLLRLPKLGATEQALTEAGAFTGMEVRFDESLLPQKLVVILSGGNPDPQKKAKLERCFQTLLPGHLTVEYRYVS